MYKTRSFIVFEGIEGSGKSIHSLSLVRKLKSLKVPCIYLREPGGSKEAEHIRNFILRNINKKFNSLTDTLLYLAARNENFLKKIKPFYKKKIIICDRFVDSTLAYQHYGFGVKKNVINFINKEIMGTIKPDYTFLMYLNVNKSISRISNKKKINRYDKFSKSFYTKVQNGFLKICNKNKSKYMIINSSNKFETNKDIIFNQVKKLII
jgi:dTMP kinase|tara:strand:+ start:2716 stop:3339 length:624 start_codon:yes stop_codon:yes gene_type:complete